MELNNLTAISPIDGRYRNQVSVLAPFYAEFGLIKYRVQIEIEYSQTNNYMKTHNYIVSYQQCIEFNILY